MGREGGAKVLNKVAYTVALPCVSAGSYSSRVKD